MDLGCSNRVSCTVIPNTPRRVAKRMNWERIWVQVILRESLSLRGVAPFRRKSGEEVDPTSIR